MSGHIAVLPTLVMDILVIFLIVNYQIYAAEHFPYNLTPVFLFRWRGFGAAQLSLLRRTAVSCIYVVLWVGETLQCIYWLMSPEWMSQV
jgi:hypothetical protein